MSEDLVLVTVSTATAPHMVPDYDAVCTGCRYKGGHGADCPRGDEPWPMFEVPTVVPPGAICLGTLPAGAAIGEASEAQKAQGILWTAELPDGSTATIGVHGIVRTVVSGPMTLSIGKAD